MFAAAMSDPRVSFIQLDQEHRKREFMSLAKQNEAVLVRVARRLCWQNPDLADDCVQEAIVSGYKAYVAGNYRDTNNFRSWILRILVNAFYREAGKISKLESVADVEVVGDDTRQSLNEDPEQILMNTYLSEDLELALRSLPVEQRVCVTLVDIEEMSYDEAALALHIPVGTVRSRLTRARLRMAQQLQAGGAR